MSDNVILSVGKQQINTFLEYQVSSSLFDSSDGFSFTAIPTGLENIKNGDFCNLTVNGQPELRGIIQDINPSVEKGDESVEIIGTDLLGELVKRHPDEFPTLQDISLEDLTDLLISPLDILDMDDIIFADPGSKDKIVQGKKSAGLFSSDTKTTTLKINPGESIFDILANQARLLGLRIFSSPAGKIIFGQPKTINAGEKGPTIDKKIVLSARKKDSIAGLYDTVNILGSNTKSLFGGAQKDLNVKGTASLSDFPGVPPLPDGFKRVLNITQNTSSEDANLQARLILARQIFESQSLELTLYNHTQSQSFTPWQTNQIAKVNLEYKSFRVRNENYIIYERSFLKSKESGETTNLSLTKMTNISL